MFQKRGFLERLHKLDSFAYGTKSPAELGGSIVQAHLNVRRKQLLRRVRLGAI
jgi:hypothetical protein